MLSQSSTHQQAHKAHALHGEVRCLCTELPELAVSVHFQQRVGLGRSCVGCRVAKRVQVTRTNGLRNSLSSTVVTPLDLCTTSSLCTAVCWDLVHPVQQSLRKKGNGSWRQTCFPLLWGLNCSPKPALQGAAKAGAPLERARVGRVCSLKQLKTGTEGKNLPELSVFWCLCTLQAQHSVVTKWSR